MTMIVVLNRSHVKDDLKVFTSNPVKPKIVGEGRMDGIQETGLLNMEKRKIAKICKLMG